MLRDALARLWLRAWSSILIEMSAEEVLWLFWPAGHLSLLSSRRATIILTRVRLVAGLFAVLTPLWIVIDMQVFQPEVWHSLAWARFAASAAFASILLLPLRPESMRDAYRGFALLLAVPCAFYLFTYEHMALFDLAGIESAIATGYSFLPFVMLAGLSIFPLTLVECIAFALPMLLMPVAAAFVGAGTVAVADVGIRFWLLLLIVAVSSLAGLSQLAFMIVFIREAIRDNMTGCFTRHSGEELLDLQFILATRVHAPLSVAFIDLDHFKRINDSFGHDAGDAVLKDATAKLRKHLRAGDMLARWGGEEFVLIMPNTSARNACLGLERACADGLCLAPDRQSMTASIGVAERGIDGASTWQQLVELADARMYEAKKSGRNRIVGCDREFPQQ